MPWVDLPFVIVAFPGNTHLLNMYCDVLKIILDNPQTLISVYLYLQTRKPWNKLPVAYNLSSCDLLII